MRPPDVHYSRTEQHWRAEPEPGVTIDLYVAGERAAVRLEGHGEAIAAVEAHQTEWSASPEQEGADIGAMLYWSWWRAQRVTEDARPSITLEPAAEPPPLEAAVADRILAAGDAAAEPAVATALEHLELPAFTSEDLALAGVTVVQSPQVIVEPEPVAVAPRKPPVRRRQRPPVGVGNRIGVTLSGRLTDEERRAAVQPHEVVSRPRTRAECASGPRPCPFVACRHHLAVEVTSEQGVLLVHGHSELEQIAETCSLDVADRGDHTLEEVATLLSVSRERIRQTEDSAVRALRKRGVLIGHS